MRPSGLNCVWTPSTHSTTRALGHRTQIPPVRALAAYLSLKKTKLGPSNWRESSTSSPSVSENRFRVLTAYLENMPIPAAARLALSDVSTEAARVFLSVKGLRYRAGRWRRTGADPMTRYRSFISRRRRRSNILLISTALRQWSQPRIYGPNRDGQPPRLFTDF